MTFTASLALPSTYTLYDASGGILTTAVSATGSFNINGLCPEAYLLDVIQNNVTTTYYFNIPTVILNPGDAISQSVCSTDGVLNLNQLLNAADLTGNWMDPTFQTISNLINASTMTDGWYTYALPSNGCLVTSGIYVDFIQNADPGKRVSGAR